MKRQRKEQDRVVVNSSPFFMLGYICMLCLLIEFACLLVFSASFKASMDGIWLWFYIIIIPLCIILLVVLGTKLAFSRVELSKEGVKTSLFGVLCKKQFSWEEIKDIGRISQAVTFVLFSKAETLNGMTYSKAVWSKDVIMVQRSRKLVEAVRRFAAHLLDDETPMQENKDTMSARQYRVFSPFRYPGFTLSILLVYAGIAVAVIGFVMLKVVLWWLGVSIILFALFLSLIWGLIFERKYATKAYLHRLQKQRSEKTDPRKNRQDRS